MSLTEDQKKRIEESKRRAQEIRLSKGAKFEPSVDASIDKTRNIRSDKLFSTDFYQKNKLKHSVSASISTSCSAETKKRCLGNVTQVPIPHIQSIQWKDFRLQF